MIGIDTIGIQEHAQNKPLEKMIIEIRNKLRCLAKNVKNSTISKQIYTLTDMIRSDASFYNIIIEDNI